MLNRMQGCGAHAEGKMARGNAEVKPLLGMRALYSDFDSEQ